MPVLEIPVVLLCIFTPIRRKTNSGIRKELFPEESSVESKELPEYILELQGTVTGLSLKLKIKECIFFK